MPQYRIVAPTSFKLEYNTFAQFNLSMLNFPGIIVHLMRFNVFSSKLLGCQKVLLGSLSVNKNKVKCECSQLKVRAEQRNAVREHNVVSGAGGGGGL